MPQYDSWTPAVSVPSSSDPRIEALIADHMKWASSSLTYSFPQANALWVSGYPQGANGADPTVGFTPLTAANADQFRTSMEKWAELINVNITEVSDGTNVGDIRAAYYGGPQGYVGFANYPWNAASGGDVWFSPGTAGYKPGIQEGWPHPYTLMLHEIGHALGLSHPDSPGNVWLPDDQRDTLHTVMETDDIYNFSPTTPMVLDVLAIQSLYGANHQTRAGDDTYLYDDSRVYDETIWDGGGNDTLAYAGTRDAKIDLNDGHSSRIGQALYSVVNGIRTDYDNVWIAYGAAIENARGGSGNDTLIGNGGNNVLDGGDGRDTVVASAGHDAYTIAPTSGGFTMSGPDGTDTLLNVERVKFSDGEAVALDIDGNAGRAYRLYQAAFDRQPDLPGLGYQMNDLDKGNSLEWVASNFIASPEFQSKYGTPDNTQYITLLYEHVLHREPDSSGLQFHLGEFARGDSRASMLIHFSESPENQANVIGQIADGMLYVPVS